MNENSAGSPNSGMLPGERNCAYRILRYTPNLVRDEWVNIGVLLFDPQTGERRLRLIEEQDEYNRVRRLHPQADENLLRALRDDLEDRFQAQSANGSNGGSGNWQQLLGKWDDTLSNALQLAPQKGVIAADLDAELERLYPTTWPRSAPPAASERPGAAPRCVPTVRRFSGRPACGSASRNPCAPRNSPSPAIPCALITATAATARAVSCKRFPSPARPADAKLLAYTAERIIAKAALKTEFAAVTDVTLNPTNDRHRFVRDTLREAGIEPIPMEGFAVWVAKLKPDAISSLSFLSR